MVKYMLNQSKYLCKQDIKKVQQDIRLMLFWI